MSLTDQIKKASLRTAFGYLEKNPQENALKLMTWVDRLAGEGPDSLPPCGRCWRTPRTICTSW